MTTVTLLSDITYAEADGRALQLDLYRPESEGQVPAVIYLHGGGWGRGDKADDAQTRLQPAAAHGIAVLSVNYRLAPAAVYPAQIHDVKAAIRWTRAHGAEYGLNTNVLGLWGHLLARCWHRLPGSPPTTRYLKGRLEKIETNRVLCRPLLIGLARQTL